jgi:hypothetical protein
MKAVSGFSPNASAARRRYVAKKVADPDNGRMLGMIGNR